jgi:hypothetical protein
VYREVLAKRPNILIKNKTDKTCLLVDMAKPSDRNIIIQKKAENNFFFNWLLQSLSDLGLP